MKGYSKDGKVLHAMQTNTIRELVETANDLEIPREDIVSILEKGGHYVLFYYCKGV